MSLSKAAETKSRQFSLPDFFTELVEAHLKAIGFSLQKSPALAQAVKKLSDYYIENPTLSTPWHLPWAQAGYLAYFFPLNYLRMNAVMVELERVRFFEGLDRYVDFGCGLSALPFFAKNAGLKHGVGIDKSVEILHLLESLLDKSGYRMRLYQQFNGIYDEDKELGVFSYVITETQKLPAWAVDLEALLIIEPSTRTDGRYLMDLRGALLEDGYHAWAPCTHQQNCPLFEHSKKDWCHDRIYIEMPEWYQNLERLLPMKNKTITFSYLAVRRTPPLSKPNLARSVGDLLDEKGKYRQLICRSESREFLAWLKREHSEAPNLLRGQVFEVPIQSEKKSDELRLPTGVDVRLTY